MQYTYSIPYEHNVNMHTVHIPSTYTVYSIPYTYNMHTVHRESTYVCSVHIHVECISYKYI